MSHNFHIESDVITTYYQSLVGMWRSKDVCIKFPGIYTTYCSSSRLSDLIKFLNSIISVGLSPPHALYCAGVAWLRAHLSRCVRSAIKANASPMRSHFTASILHQLTESTENENHCHHRSSSAGCCQRNTSWPSSSQNSWRCNNHYRWCTVWNYSVIYVLFHCRNC